MKLYPEFYDCGFYNEARKRHEEEERRRREIEPLLRKVYGEPDPPSTPPQVACWFTLPPLSAAKRRKVEKLEAERKLWMSIAKEIQAKADKQLKQPRPLLPSFGTLASLLDLGFTLKRIACGLETNFKPDPHATLYERDVYADLERAYGNHTIGTA